MAAAREKADPILKFSRPASVHQSTSPGGKLSGIGRCREQAKCSQNENSKLGSYSGWKEERLEAQGGISALLSLFPGLGGDHSALCRRILKPLLRRELQTGLAT